MKLDDLDERLVPRVAAALRAFVDGAADRRARSVAAVRRTTSSALSASSHGSLRRLDDRFASRGPLALLRDVPQLGLLLVAAVFLSGAGVALQQSSDQNRSDTDRQLAETAIPTTLGPAPGTAVAAYVEGTRKRAAALSQGAPNRSYTALVSFSRYVTAEQARLLLGELEVTRVLARVQLPAAEVLPIPVTAALVTDVQTTFSAVAARKVRDRKEFLSLAATITGATKEEKQFKAFYLDAGTTAGKEAAAYGKNCACLFAALVRGKARELAALPALSGIRAVDIGGGNDDTVQLQPLLPEQKVTVSKPLIPGQGTGS